MRSAAIWESAVWIGCPARSRMTRMSAYRESDNDLHTTEDPGSRQPTFFTTLDFSCILPKPGTVASMS